MGDPLSVVILVAAGGAADPATLAIERAASEALGRTARIAVRESMGTPTDGEALAAGSEEGERAAVEVIWADGAHRLAMLRVHLAGSGRWIDRAIGFGAGDADSERGRTIGFAVASMLPEPDAGAEARPTTLPAEGARGSRAGPASSVGENAAPGPAPGSLRYALEFFGLGAAPIGGDMQAGGGGAFETFFASRLSIRVSGAVRAGPVDGAQARALTLRGAAGFAVRPWGGTASHAFAASFRADYVIASQSVTHYATSGADVSTRARSISGFDAFVDTEWRVGPGVDALVGVGVEEMFAKTYVDLDGARVATLPPLSAVAETGVRFRF